MSAYLANLGTVSLAGETLLYMTEQLVKIVLNITDSLSDISQQHTV